MKIAVFNSSPKTKRSNTHVVAAAFLAGAAEAGADTEEIFLAPKKINHCLGCLNCWLKTPGKCVHQDDMTELIEIFFGADIAVFATPLYVDNVSGVMKNFMDRLIPVMDPHFVMGSDGETQHVKSRDYPSIGVISTCGFPEQSHFQTLKLLFRRIARNMPATLAFEIYRSQGALLGIETPMLKPILDGYLKTVSDAGAEVVREGGISGKTAAALDMPLIPIEMHIAEANKYWDKMIAKNTGAGK